MKPREITITLQREDLELFERGGSVDFEFRDGDDVRAIVHVELDDPSRSIQRPRLRDAESRIPR